MRKLRTALALSAAERTLLARAWTGFLWTALALRLLPLPKAQSLLATLYRRPLPREVPAVRLAELVDVASRHHLLSPRCLQRALVLQNLLRAQGGSADLRIGVRRHGSAIEAHAWVEQEGRPVGESRDHFSFLPLELIDAVSHRSFR